MGFEGPPKMPPLPPKAPVAEKPPEQVVQQETPAVEVQQEVALEPTQETPQEEIATPVEPNPLESGGEYAGYSEAGMLEDKKNEAELSQLLDVYSRQLSGTERDYFASNDPETMKRGAKIVEEIRQSLDKQLQGTKMKNVKEYSTIYFDKFYKKYSELLLKGTV